MSDAIHLTIPLAPITKKNHQKIKYRGSRCPVCKRGTPFIDQSDAYKQYEQDCLWFLTALQIDRPVNVKALYYMPTRGRVDLINLHSALHDVLVKAGVVVDDDSRIIASTDGSRVLYDKHNPRTEVWISEATNP